MEIRVPELGDFEDVEVIEIHISPGAEVAPEDPLITLETDKAAMEVPAPAAGTVAEVRVAVGDRVSEGDVIGLYAAGDDSQADAAQSSTEDSRSAEEPEAPDSGVSADATSSSDVAAETTQLIVEVPDLGDFSDVEVIEVHVSPGVDVAIEDPLITLETDKAAMDVPAPASGTVVAVGVSVGQTVSQGDVILEMTVTAASAVPTTAADVAAVEAKTPAEPPAQADTRPTPAPASTPGSALPRIDEAGFSRAHASPSVRKLARELGVDLAQVTGTGAKGRVIADDVKAWVKATLAGGVPAGNALPEVPAVDFSRFGPVEVRPLTRVQKISGPRLHASWVNLPHVTQHDEADITDLEARRQAMKKEAADAGIRLTPLAFVMRAVALALDSFPGFNASLSEDGKSLVYKQYCHLGFAADTPDGLLVPVIRDAADMNVLQLAQALSELSEKARDGKLSPTNMQGGSFTVSSLGGIGGTAFTPIINAPEVAILGVSRSAYRPVYRDGDFEPRLILPLSLSYDHRVIDGAAGVRFTTHLAELLGDPDVLVTE
jgi:pyruvate dehydrogenase E2 component (dihydrolipoamide acetyltransferase)